MQGKNMLFIVLLLSIAFGLSCGPAAAPPLSAPGTTSPVVSGKSGWEERWDSILTEARKEKGALIYMAPSPDMQRAMTASFKRKFDLDLEFVIGRGAVIAEKVFAERRAGLYLGDVVVMGNTVQLLLFKPQDALQALDPLLILPEIMESKVWMGDRVPFLDKDHKVMFFFANIQNVIVRNTDLVGESEIKSLSDLLQPRWKGQIVMFDPSITGSGQAWFSAVYRLIGREKATEYMRQLVKQEPVITRDDRIIIEGVARGKYKLGVGISKGLFLDFKRKGAAIESFRTEEGYYVSPGIGALSLLKNAPHPNAAIVFLNWLLSKEGQTVVSESAATPSVRLDVPTTSIEPHNVIPPGTKLHFETEEETLARDELMVLAREIFALLTK